MKRLFIRREACQNYEPTYRPPAALPEEIVEAIGHHLLRLEDQARTDYGTPAEQIPDFDPND